MAAVHGSLITDLERAEIETDLDKCIEARRGIRGFLKRRQREGTLDRSYAQKLSWQVDSLTRSIKRYERELS